MRNKKNWRVVSRPLYAGGNWRIVSRRYATRARAVAALRSTPLGSGVADVPESCIDVVPACYVAEMRT